MNARTACGIAIAGLLGTIAAPATALAQQDSNERPAPRIAIQATAGTRATDILDAAGALPFGIAVRIVAPDLDEFPQDALRDAAARRAGVWLAVPAPDSPDAVEAWRTSISDVIVRYGDALTVLEVLLDDQPAPLAAFAVRLAATETRARADATIRLAVGGRRMAEDRAREEIYTRDLAAYIDLLSVPAAESERAGAWLSTIDPNASLIVTEVGAPGAAARRTMVDAILRYAGTNVTLYAIEGSEGLPAALRAAAPLAVLLTHDISDLDDEGASLQITVGGADARLDVPHRLLFDNQTFGTFLAYWGEASSNPLEVSIQLTIAGTVVVQDVVGGTEGPAEIVSQDGTTRRLRLRVPRTGEPMLVEFNRGAVDLLADRTDVTAAAGLSVAEIIARHQARQRQQDTLVRNYIAIARTEQHFRPNITDAGYDVVSENRYFVAGRDVEWEELAFYVNGSRWGADRPPFPLLQPEKVLSLPLLLQLDEGYRYRLSGTERVSGYDCYVVRFEPARNDPSLYRGTVWIDRETFARIRVQAVQGGLAPPVVSNEEILEYAPPVTVDGRPVHLLADATARLIMLIAGRNLLVEKRVTFEQVRVNDERFLEEREAARSSDRIMFRETDEGLRYYVKEGTSRVVADRPTLTAKALAMGVTIDPSYAFPLPIFGINYLDFDFGGPDSQFALLFGGVLAAGNIQFTSLGDTPFDASVDFFGIAVPSSDRLYDAQGEREDERVLTWAMTAGLNTGWQYTPFQKVTLQYHARFDPFTRDTTTADDFTMPSSTVTHGVGAVWDYRRWGYSLILNGAAYRRASWRAWGPSTAEGAPQHDQGPRDYAKYGASLSRDFYFNVFHKIHLNAAWFGGHDLDRFSKYQFGLFDDTRIHGVPASGIRLTDLGMARGSYSLNIFEQYRLDLFLERAWGRDIEIDRDWQPITGLGTAISLRGPLSTILRAEFGRSLLPERYRAVGSYNLQILVLKPLG